MDKKSDLKRKTTKSKNSQNMRPSAAIKGSASLNSQLLASRKSCLDQLKSFDKSSYVLSAYIPSPARDTFIAIRTFNLEISKIFDVEDSSVNKKLSSSIGLSTGELKLKFWDDLLTKIHNNPFGGTVVGEPVGVLLRDSLRNEFNLDINLFHQIIESRKVFIKKGQFLNVDEICSYGEGVYSQLNYLTQNLLLSDQLSPSTVALVEESGTLRDLMVEIMAHIGQATGVASVVLGTNYYARHHNRIYLPVDLMTKHDLSQEALLRLFQGHEKDVDPSLKSKLKDLVYETSISANDHLLTARNKLEQLKQETQKVIQSTDNQSILKRSSTWKKGLPDCLFVPFMSSIPLEGYLNQLEKHDFDILGGFKIENPYWKVVWRSYRSYKNRTI